ncbi:MAG: tape measure protein [Patescibacteria group bacterium]|jgi:tape measure domain-containing protein
MATALPKAGVALVVEGLASFKNKMGQANNVLAAMKPKAGLLERAFKSLGNTIRDFAHNTIQRILVIAFGVLVRDAIRKVIDVLGELGRAVIEGGDAFQRLEIRLNRFNMNALKDSGMEANKIMAETIRLTKEQIGWTLDLAGLTIYDAKDIANAYSLARSYGFVDMEARGLTEDILNFVSGMGLTGMQVERIVTNLGQMVQQGKITGTELRDLARGSLVPVNKILGIIAESMGMTTDELNKMRKAGTTDPQWFVQAFGQFVGEDFESATEDMAKSFTGAMDNVKDIFVSRLSAMVSSPIMSKLGEKLSSILLGFYKGKTIKPEFAKSFERIGNSLVRIIDKLFALLPGVNSIADGIIKMLQNMAGWLERNEGNIVNWISSAIDFMGQLAYSIKTEVIPWITNKLLPALDRFGKWFSENKGTILSVLKTIGVTWLVWQGALIVIRLIIGALMVFVGWLGAIALKQAAFKGFGEVLKFIGITITGLLGPIAWVVAAIAAAAIAWGAWGLYMSNVGRNLVENIKGYFNDFDWSTLGSRMMEGIKTGLMIGSLGLFGVVIWIAKTAMSLWNSFFQMKSPSKLMEESGINIMAGLSKGMAKGAGLVAKVTTSTASAIANGLSGKAGTGFGVSSSATKNYLSPVGEVMRSKLDTTTGTDPCAKGGVASCLADSVGSAIGGALGGTGSGLLGMIGNLGTELKDMIRGYATEDLKNASEFYDTGKEELARLVAMIATTPTVYERVKDDITKLNTYATEDLKNKSAFFVSSVQEIQRLNNERAKSSTDIFIARVVETNNAAESTLLSNSKFVIDMIQVLINAALTKINSGSILPQPTSNGTRTVVPIYRANPSSLMPYMVKGMSMSKTTNVTNNFNNSQAGKRVSFDYENSQFWV